MAEVDIDTAGSNGGVESFGSFFPSVLGGIDKFLNLTTWYVMKNRSGIVGGTGVAQAVRDLKASNKNIRLHLVGHSLGGRLMAACAKSLAKDPILQPDSVTLLEAAFSHYGFSANNGKGTPGFFRDVIAKKVVKGPLLETFSFQDTVVGPDLRYCLASGGRQLRSHRRRQRSLRRHWTKRRAENGGVGFDQAENRRLRRAILTFLKPESSLAWMARAA